MTGPWYDKWRLWVDYLGPHGDWARRELLDRRVLGLLKNVNGKKILDVGCGEGRLTRMLGRRGAEVVGIDSVPGLVALAQAIEEGRVTQEDRKRWPWLQRVRTGRSCSGNVTYQVADVARLPKRLTCAFDGAVVCCTLNSVAELDGAVRAVSRSLKEYGVCILAIPHPQVIWPQLAVPAGTPVFNNRLSIPYEEFIAPGLEVPNHYHPMAKLLNSFGKNRLLLEHLEEPLLSDPGSRRNCGEIEKVMSVRGFPHPSKAPWFLIARFVKVPVDET